MDVCSAGKRGAGEAWGKGEDGTGGEEPASKARVCGILLGDEDDVRSADVFVALCGAGRFLRHYLGLRKSGPNAVVRAHTDQGANDGFLRCYVATRNGAGIAAGSPVVINFGPDYDATAAHSSLEEPSTKRLRGALDLLFLKAATGAEAGSASSGGGLSPQPVAPVARTPPRSSEAGGGMSPHEKGTSGPPSASPSVVKLAPTPTPAGSGGDEVVATVPAQTPPSGESKVAEPVAASPKSPAPEKLLPKAWDPKVPLGPDASKILLADDIPPGKFRLEFDMPIDGAGGALTLVSTDKSNRKIPPRTALVFFRTGRVMKGAELSRSSSPQSFERTGRPPDGRMTHCYEGISLLF
jgi:hypothetical protein